MIIPEVKNQKVTIIVTCNFLNKFKKIILLYTVAIT